MLPPKLSPQVKTAAPSQGQSIRLRTLVEAHYDFAWRSLRRLGVPAASVDDAAQQLFIIIAAKLDLIRPECERSFVFGTAVRVASDNRRHNQREENRSIEVAPESLPGNLPNVEQLLEQKRARELLDRLLDRLPIELRTVLILTEGEQMTMNEVALLCEVPQGTVASRLRRARAALAAALAEELRYAQTWGESA